LSTLLTITIENGPNRAAREWAARFLAVRMGFPFRIERESASKDRPRVHFGRSAPPEGVFVRHGGFFDGEIDRTHPADEPAIFEGMPLPFGRPRVERTARRSVIEADLFSSVFHLANRSEETRPVERDEHGRFRAAATFMGRRGALEKPAAEIWAGALAREVSRLYPSLEPRPRWGGAPFAVCVTHDVETLAPINRLGYAKGRLLAAARFVKKGRAADAALSVFSGLSRTVTARAPSWSFEDLRAGERPAAGTYFFFGTRTSHHDGVYDVAREPVRSKLADLIGEGCEIGVHLGYESCGDAASMCKQKTRLEQAAGTPVKGARHHYLRLDLPACWKAHEEAGLEYEASLGFAEAPGFRGASALPYRPFDTGAGRALGFHALPLAAMDGTFLRYMGLDAQETVRRVLALAETVRSAGGVFQLLWHNTLADRFDKPAESRAYRAICRGLRKLNGAWMTAGECVSAWRDYEDSLEVRP